MKHKRLQYVCLIGVLLMMCPALTAARGENIIALPAPQKDIGRPLMQVLQDRKSSRAFSPEKLPAQVLSNLLWAAAGVNRAESDKRTAPSAVNWQEVDIYVATAEGLFLYHPKGHGLEQILTKDIRSLTGSQKFVASVPVNLVYVADFTRMGKIKDETKAFYSAADTGFISQNVYLYCASEGLATVVRGLVDKPALAKAMQLGPNQRVILSQSVGYPAK